MYFTGPFDRTVDVIVVGFGDAGAVTAVTAHDLGAEVLIVEKQEADRRRPNSRFSGGLFISPADVDTAEHYMRQLYRINDDLYETDPSIIRAWAEETSRNADWIRAHGGECFKFLDHGEHRYIEGYESIHLYKPDMNDHPGATGHRGFGYGLFKFLEDHVAARGLDVMYGCAARRLLTDASGAVLGLRVATGSRELNLGASRGVVLTCGGFEFNKWMKWNFLRVNPTHFYGNPENTGDGILMAQEVGAELWHMNSCAARVVGYFPESGYPGGCSVDIWGVEGTDGIRLKMNEDAGAGAVNMTVADTEVRIDRELPGALFVDRHGRRYTSELYRAHTLYYELSNFDSQRLEYPKVPSWWIFDSRRYSMGRITPNYVGPSGPLKEIEWSGDNSEEVAKGWIRSAHSISELAEKCGIDGSVLSATVDRYNRACAEGVDTDFSRPAGTLSPIAGPTYYAVQLWPGGPNTQGGPRRNADSQVMRVTGEPIPGLYSAGELGSIYGMLYPSGGGNIAECLAFGRIAGRNVSSVRR
jgi:succinate dehydrogenase/fumarate reductase flavoprotein subunit